MITPPAPKPSGTDSDSALFQPLLNKHASKAPTLITHPLSSTEHPLKSCPPANKHCDTKLAQSPPCPV